MAVTLTELITLENDTALSNKVKAALWMTAIAIQEESDQTPNHANRLKLAKQVLTDSNGHIERFYRYVLAANADLAANVGAITGASDTAIRTAVAAAVNIFADGN